MLKSRNLDDQNFSEIVEHAVKRIPQLCEDWTNFNPADPGITFIELLAWYKEMQQYHMNYYTDELKLKLLKLLGSEPLENHTASCIISVPEECGGYVKGSRLITPEHVYFELSESIPVKRSRIDAIYAAVDERYIDITQMIQLTESAIPVFSFGVEKATSLVIAFSEIEEKQLSIWFDLKDPGMPKRNLPETGQEPPRRILWEMSGVGEVKPVIDETYGFSQSGFVRFEIPKGWTKRAANTSGDPAYMLRISCEDEGCEEQVRLNSVSVSRYKAEQRKVISDLRMETADEQTNEFIYQDYLAYAGTFTVFVRSARGWKQAGFEEITGTAGRGVRPDLAGAVYDGKPNVAVSLADPEFYLELFLDADGLPDSRIRIDLRGRQALKEHFILACDRILKNGNVVQEFWKCVDSLDSYGPSDRVFAYDEENSEIVFGDGNHGHAAPSGVNAIYVASIYITMGVGGNIPAGKRLSFKDDGLFVENTEACGGRNRETVEEAAGRFLRSFNKPMVCVSAEDYEAMACRTPGLRVLAAKAIPGFDPDEPTGRSRGAVVTVVVVPAGDEPHPMPNQGFIDTIERFLEGKRNICTRIKVRGPRYMPVSIKAELICSGAVKEQDVLNWMAGHMEQSFRSGERRIGDPVKLSQVYSLLQQIPGVIAVRQAQVKAVNSMARVTGIGDLDIPADAIPYVESVSIVKR